MARLLACPFCRELHGEHERTICPECDIPLVPMERLPPSAEGIAEEIERGEYVPPEHRSLSPWFWQRGRGALLLLSALGLGLFFAPWVSLERPSDVALSGFDLAAGNAGWLWGGAVGWFILVPLLLSRRTVAGLRGARVIAVTFACMTAGEVVLLLLRPPVEHQYFSSGLAYEWGLYGSGLVSLAAMLAAFRLGGRTGDLSGLPVEGTSSETSSGQIIH